MTLEKLHWADSDHLQSHFEICSLWKRIATAFGSKRAEMEQNLNDSQLGFVDDRSISLSRSSSTRSLDTTSESERLAFRESLAVTKLRNVVSVVMMLATFIVSTSVYISSRRGQVHEFVVSFNTESGKVLVALESAMEQKMKAMDGLAVDISSLARSGWPEVLTPDYAERGASFRAMGDLPLVATFPVVNDRTRSQWEQFSTENQAWISEGIAWEKKHGGSGVSMNSQALVARSLKNIPSIPGHIFNSNGTVIGNGPFAPLFQVSPISEDMIVWENFDALSSSDLSDGLRVVLDKGAATLGKAVFINSTISLNQLGFVESLFRGNSTLHQNEPISVLAYPIFDDRFALDVNVTAILVTYVFWGNELATTALDKATSTIAVVSNGCDQTFSYTIDESGATFNGVGDFHDPSYDWAEKKIEVESSGGRSSLYHHVRMSGDICPYTVSLFPSKKMETHFVSSRPIWLSTAVSCVFLVACCALFFYDYLVERRQKVVMDRAIQSTNIIASLFPQQVRERLFQEDNNDLAMDTASAFHNASMRSNISEVMVQPAKHRIKSFLSDDHSAAQGGGVNKPIADLFPECTVLFADIAGFTAWSSLRDPCQVFTLLENVYGAFDAVARRRGVFKVETVGDSYVAVTGLPDPQEDHAIIMARFARDCRAKMYEVTRKLELTLGVDTVDLRMRFGLHSGPVTAGVLRGEKSRFQLFGDTVNTAARMESTGERDRIQCSQATADILRRNGKARWVKPRETLVNAKGKGSLQTYWIEIMSNNSQNSRRSSNSSEDSRQSLTNNEDDPPERSMLWGVQDDMKRDDSQGIYKVRQRSKHLRLIDYNVDLLSQHLKIVIARRQSLRLAGRRCSQGGMPLQAHSFSTDEDSNDSSKTVIDEVSEVIRLPNFNARAFKDAVDPESIELDPNTVDQLKRYVTIIAAMYRGNPFHNFEHASHVTMSVNKLLSRVVAPENFTYRRGSMTSGQKANQIIASNLHNYTFGITSDPLTQLAVVFGALIHDVDHWGVSNGQLQKEGSPIAEKYRNKSIAEQNSVDRAWDLLLDKEQFGDLQAVIFPTEAEYKRFRQVVVNVVMATDIFDKELNELRTKRWSKAFAEKAEDDPECENRKATIVIEHIMQASDVAHSMQHWLVYQKWNRRLFDELYSAYLKGRMPTNPADFWYEGEISFFEGYVIPLAKKLKDCGVFGVASDECLNYAMDNLEEWKKKGQMIATELVTNYHQRELEESQANLQADGASGGNRKKRVRMNRRRSLVTTGG